MEARANHLWVGIVTLALLAALAAGIVWMAELRQGPEEEYDVLYSESVAGLTKGSQVSFAGVPVGQVQDIVVSDPEFVRVRIRITEDVPINVGTTATIQASFTGVASILLDGAQKQNPKVSCENSACTYGAPIIPSGTGVLGKLVADAPLVLERLATMTERLNQVFGDENQAQLSAILRNSTEASAGLAASMPELRANFTDFRGAIGELNATLAQVRKTAETAEGAIATESKAITTQLQGSLARANKAADTLTATLEKTAPAVETLNGQTLPAAEATLQDLRTTSRSLRAITERLESEGIGSLVGTQALPDYEPKK